MRTVLRSARALAWLRWRLFLNTLRGTHRRDALERLSRAGSVILPIVLGLMFVPAFLATCALSLAGGWYVGRGLYVSGILLAVRIALVVVTGMILFIPAIRSAHGPSPNLVRLTLLPVPRKVLHFADLLAGLTDPWIALLVPVMVLFPVGIALSGRVLTGLIALAAGIALLLAFLALESTVSSLLALLYRDRRRGEIVTLVVLLALSLSGFIPMMVSQRFGWSMVRTDRQRDRGEHRAERDRAEKGRAEADRAELGRPPDHGTTPPAGDEAALRAPAEVEAPAATGPSGPTQGAGTPQDPPLPEARQADGSSGAESVSFPLAASILPSELFARALVEPLRGRTGMGLLALLGVAGLGAAVYGLSWTAYRRLLDSPESFSPRRGARVEPSAWRLPGLGPAASAVAQAQFRLVLRTVQGKMAIFFTPVSLLIAGFMISRIGRPINLLGSSEFPLGPVYAYAGATFALLAPQRFLLNVFATDGAGLTLALLSPISDTELVVGKSVGMGILSAIPMLIITFIIVLLSPPAPIALWAAVILAAGSSYLVLAPSGALLSAIFPKAANMNRLSGASNPNGIASMIGLLMTAVACGPPAVVAAITFLATGSPVLVLLAVLGYTVVAALLSLVLTHSAARIVAARRENLALVAQGR